MTKHYVKAVFTEHWDPHQLNFARYGGNQKLYEFLCEYNLEKAGLHIKYKSRAAKYYRDLLCTQITGCPLR